MAKKLPPKKAQSAAPWWPLSLIALAGLAAYANSFAGVLVFDDIHNVAENPFLRRLWPPWEAMFRSPSLPTRPLPYYTFAINYAVSGASLWSYHALNLAIHLAAAAALYEIVRRTLLEVNSRWKTTLPAVGLALAIALIWVIHPIQTQAVTYVYQRIESLMGLCLLLTLLTFIIAIQTPPATRNRWLMLSVLCCAAGMASKEVMVVAPLVVLWFDRAFVAETWRDLAKNRWQYYSGLLATWGILGLAVWSQSGQYAELTEPPHTRAEYFFSQPGVVLWYLKLLVWPQGQCLDYGWQPFEGWRQVVLPLAVMLVLLSATGWLMARHPPLGFVAGSFFLVLSVTSSVLVVADLANEHRMYIPSAAAIALAVLGIYGLLQWAGKASPGIASRQIQFGLLAAATIALGLATHLRNRDYRSYLVMWEDVVAKTHFHVRACRNLIQTYSQTGETERGIALCREQVARKPDSVVAQLMLGEAFFLARRFDEAETIFRQALAQKPKFEDAEYNLGLVAAERGEHEQAVAHFRRAIELFPQFQKAHHALGKSLAVLGRGDEAAESFRRAIAVSPYSTEAMQDLAVILDVQGRSAEAIELLRDYLEVHPEHLSAWDSLGIACLSRRDYRGAAEAFQQVLARDPQQHETRLSLAQALAASGRVDDALTATAEGMQLARQSNQPQVFARLTALRAKIEQQATSNSAGP